MKKIKSITPLYLSFSNKFTNPIWLLVSITIAFIVLVAPRSSFCIEKISLNQQAKSSLVTNKTDLTKLPRGETFKVVDDDFVLQFFFNNRDIFGYILKRKKNIGIIAQLCLYRSCEETSYDFRKIIARPFEPPYEKDFFSVKFPQKLQYEFQGLEFLTYE